MLGKIKSIGMSITDEKNELIATNVFPHRHALNYFNQTSKFKEGSTGYKRNHFKRLLEDYIDNLLDEMLGN